MLQDYEFDVQHRPGKIHKNADALSRICCQTTSEDQSSIKLKETADINKSVIETAQKADPFCQFMVDFLRKSDLPDDPHHAKFVATHGDNFGTLQGILYFVGPHSTSSAIPMTERLVVPPNL